MAVAVRMDSNQDEDAVAADNRRDRTGAAGILQDRKAAAGCQAASVVRTRARVVWGLAVSGIHRWRTAVDRNHLDAELAVDCAVVVDRTNSDERLSVVAVRTCSEGDSVAAEDIRSRSRSEVVDHSHSSEHVEPVVRKRWQVRSELDAYRNHCWDKALVDSYSHRQAAAAAAVGHRDSHCYSHQLGTRSRWDLPHRIPHQMRLRNEKHGRTRRAANESIPALFALYGSASDP